MAVDYTLVVKKMRNLDQVYGLISAVTRLPYVECDPEEFDDQVYLFTEEEAAKEQAKAYTEKQMPVGVMKIEKKQMPMFYTSLHLMGVNLVVFQDGSGAARVPVEEVVKLDPKLKENKQAVPLMNAALQLTAIYFMQELRRPGQKKNDPERSRKLQELEEEMTADLYRSRFILAVDVSKVPEGQDPAKSGANVQIPYVKTPSGDMYQPLFTDVWEFQKFQKKPEMKLRMAAVDFQKLLPSLVPQAKGFILNPGGVNLVLSREQLTYIGKRYGQ